MKFLKKLFPVKTGKDRFSWLGLEIRAKRGTKEGETLFQYAKRVRKEKINESNNLD